MRATDQYFGDLHLRHDPAVGFEFVELPQVLVFSLRHFDFDLLHVRRDPVSDYFSFPEELDMTRYVTRATKTYLYDIFAVLVYTGFSNGGRHFAYIKSRDQWYHFNDSVVSFASREQAVGQSFGGGSSTTAHMLIYVSRAAARVVFQPCELPRKIRDFVCDVQLRVPSGPARNPRFVRTFRLITEEDVRQHVLQGLRIEDMSDFAG
jgi:ubiquitin carboxyl-terminal hydrolase 7